MGLGLHAEQVAGIVGVIQVTELVAHHRSHAIVGIFRTGDKDFGCLVIAQPVHVHAAAARVIRPVTLGAVQGEVHVRLAITRRDERRALRFKAELFAIGFRNLLHAHIGKVDDRKQALSRPIVRSRAVDKHVVSAEYRSRSRVCGKLYLRSLGNGTIRTNGQLVQRTIVARNSIYIAVMNGKRRTDVATRQLNRTNKL